MPLFSVIIPTFNRCTLLQRAIQSVWAQTSTDYEVIVVDDGSNDGTWEWLQASGDRIVSHRLQNSGPGEARNQAARLAKGEYLAFLDSDDVWLPWTLDLYSLCIESHGRPSVVSGTGHAGPGSPSFTGGPVIERHASLLDACQGYMPPVGGTPTVAMRKDVFNRLGGFDARRCNAEDVDLWIRAGTERGFSRIAHPPVFRQSYCEISASRNMPAQVAGVQMVLDKERRGLYPGGAKHQARRRRIFSAMARSVSFDCLNSGLPLQALRLYWASLGLQLRDYRLRYIFGFPLAIIAKSARQKLLRH